MSRQALPDQWELSHEDRRRVRVYHVSERDVLDLFCTRLQDGWLMLTVCDGLPPGARILRVHHDWSSRTMGYLVQHESFDVVPDGEFPPHRGAMEYTFVKILTNGSDADILATIAAARQEGYEKGYADAQRRQE